jgi:hypothetical protein
LDCFLASSGNHINKSWRLLRYRAEHCTKGNELKQEAIVENKASKIIFFYWSRKHLSRKPLLHNLAGQISEKIVNLLAIFWRKYLNITTWFQVRRDEGAQRVDPEHQQADQPGPVLIPGSRFIKIHMYHFQIKMFSLILWKFVAILNEIVFLFLVKKCGRLVAKTIFWW